MEASDERLAMAAAAGDDAAFAALLARHYDRVFRLAFRLTGRAAEAEDLTQDVALALPAKLRGFRGDARFTTWLYRVVVNAASDRRRRSASRSRAALGWGEVERARRSEATEAAAAQTWLEDAMSTLPEALRDTVALVLDDLTHREAAEVLGVSEGTVSWRISEAKKHLKALKEAEA
ncbi:sigma-70 family RNA polymerase sigma factor [Alphaproteobacteria bacterium GH1-50]|uniref:Sigma-70 family RNA polymerase sigma factor n=1 Tax=Kangsaoukella pontilimi TaxID=2691042 RepID=A0A7C9ITK9_9RHOB|nr:RNA polymerase sigma factor [Kangsaoukella pontilimi]MXQ08865.1 sigma-70 family RNA polymerase sigma factor [Kangsaoukella pontilimi]